MCTSIEVIPFENIQGLQLLLKQNKGESIEVIDHAIVINKYVRYEYDDRI